MDRHGGISGRASDGTRSNVRADGSRRTSRGVDEDWRVTKWKGAHVEYF